MRKTVQITLPHDGGPVMVDALRAEAARRFGHGDAYAVGDPAVTSRDGSLVVIAQVFGDTTPDHPTPEFVPTVTRWDDDGGAYADTDDL
ncbi:hypothetical protein [Mariniluteicoccus flavus]